MGSRVAHNYRPYFTLIMKKTTRIVRDRIQTRTTIPRKMVVEADIKSGDKIEWELENKKLKGTLKKNEM